MLLNTTGSAKALLLYQCYLIKVLLAHANAQLHYQHCMACLRSAMRDLYMYTSTHVCTHTMQYCAIEPTCNSTPATANKCDNNEEMCIV
jgi:hypothetical protein